MPVEELHKIAPSPIYTLEEPAFNKSNNKSSQPLSHPHDKPPISRWILSLLYKLQKYSAYTFLSFLGIHLTSVVIVPIFPISKDIKEEVFSLAKAVYQGIPFYEPFVIFGSGIVHVLSGIALRFCRSKNNNKTQNKTMHQIKKNLSNNKIVIKETDDDIGFGGISNLVGLGYRRSFTSQLFGLTPLQFSGYLSLPFVLSHIFKFRYIPYAIEGDSSLVNLSYISYALKLKHTLLNCFLLTGLVWVMSYHTTNGVMKLKGLYSKNWKRIGLSVVNCLGICGCISIYLFKREEIAGEADFIGRTFTKYINSFLL
ncbi:hypothetical protein KGF56_000655 [Candida oxycetoniae]|uniref:Mitochondrial adapter protein MCP1 transmembrane domain-containing protein n=1 Tax=Candida oxycetoniae TaxID=497107 RepID=A0AAI9T0C3_9ASCO|nr:uncharacterized protein KGF56_000655 [Candida oxycetoniae]KAI3406523.2 hypothetical protein KGF56_000655 [Candida oxycetoniae]